MNYIFQVLSLAAFNLMIFITILIYSTTRAIGAAPPYTTTPNTYCTGITHFIPILPKRHQSSRGSVHKDVKSEIQLFQLL